jgi:uncharacterized membrane protein YkvA (DUF1232 family)
MADRRVAVGARTLVAAAVVYALSPLDLLPDLAPLLGQIDDVSLLWMACRFLISRTPEPILAEHRQRLMPRRLRS